MHIFIRTAECKNMTIGYHIHESIKDIKNKIYYKEGILPAN